MAFFGGRMMLWAGVCGALLLGFLFLAPRTIVIETGQGEPLLAAPTANTSSSAPEASSTETGAASSSTVNAVKPLLPSDIPNQPPMQNPPAIVKGIYLTNWTAGSEKRLVALEGLVERTELNAMVIDMKDYSGYVGWKTSVPEALSSGAENEIRIVKPNTMIKRLHDKNIYLIARISVFQDPVLSKSHPEWGIKNKETGKLWADRKGLTWLDPAAKPVWDYHVALAKDAVARGFDEVNFDYIRFPSDGDLTVTAYPFWDEVTPQRKTIAEFFAYLRAQLPGAKISADLFGLTTSAADDLGIGQKIEDTYPSFDYVSPMVYPSHFASGYIGFAKPAEHPYDVIKHSMSEALRKLRALALERTPPVVDPATGSSTLATVPDPAILAQMGKLRPWLQAFDLGAVYDESKIASQIRAADEMLAATPHYAGWLLWDPSNIYRSYKE